MKYFLSTVFVLVVAASITGQQTINGTIMAGGIQREYILYVPASYTPGTAVPLVMNFHGYTSNAFEQMFYGDFRPIADTAGFLVVHPMGTVDLIGNPHWNVGWGLSSVDDVAFTEALIDSLSALYSIHPERIYSTGMSNGGFFSYRLACELGDRIAAIASVTGAMNVNQIGGCQPSHPMPVMEIHGTADETVPYEGNFIFTPTPDVVAFWVDFNQCETPASITAIEDTDTADGCTAEHQFYGPGDNGVTVEHYRIINGQHTWPGSAFGGFGTNGDMDASKEIWRFFSKYDINGLIQISSTEDHNQSAPKVYPNPVTDQLNIAPGFDQASDYVMTDITGRVVKYGRTAEKAIQLDMETLPTGLYIITIGQHTVKVMKI